MPREFSETLSEGVLLETGSHEMELCCINLVAILCVCPSHKPGLKAQ